MRLNRHKLTKMIHFVNKFTMKPEATWLLRAIIPFLLLGGSASIEKLKNIYSWKALEFDFPSEHAKELAIQEGRFIPGAPVPLDMDFYHRGFKSFVLFSHTVKAFELTNLLLNYLLYEK